MATLCAHPTRWENRRPVEWCPEPVALGHDVCPAHIPYPATDDAFEAYLTATEAAA